MRCDVEPLDMQLCTLMGTSIRATFRRVTLRLCFPAATSYVQKSTPAPEQVCRKGKRKSERETGRRQGAPSFDDVTLEGPPRLPQQLCT